MQLRFYKQPRHLKFFYVIDIYNKKLWYPLKMEALIGSGPLMPQLKNCWCKNLKKRAHHTTNLHNVLIGHFTVVYLVAKPLIRSKADGNRVVIETCI